VSLKLPKRHLEEWAMEVIEECCQSRETRRDLIKMWKSYYYTGTSEGTVATYNRCYPHIERLGAYLYSPTDVRFDIEFDESEDEESHAMGHAAARRLNRDFHRRNLDLTFSSAVNNGLVEGCTLLKTVWGHDGLEGWNVKPTFFGVLREDIDDLDRQEAFVHTTYLTPSSFERTIVDHPEHDAIMEQVEQASMSQRESDELEDDYFHQIIVGGTQPVSTTTSSGSGMVGITGVPTPMLDRKVAARLIRIDELWVQDQERQDYTTIRLVRPNILIEGKYKRRNLCGLTDNLGKDAEMKGYQPFIKVCPNEVEGYFWGQSEIANIYKLQDSLNDQMRTIRRLTTLRGDPPRSATGFSGMTPEKYKAFKRPGGFVSEENPTAKLTEHIPELPPELFSYLDKTIQMFDDVAGFTAVMQGQGDTGVRSQQQAAMLARNSSPRMRDRSLLVERQCTELGDFALKLLQAKEAEVMTADKKTQFVLSQLPDDARVMVDSHTSSPAYQEDSEKRAFALHRAGAIDAEDLIMLTHPPHEDTLKSRAKARAEAQAKLVKEHPELAFGKGKKK
jgi:hypothetical protein